MIIKNKNENKEKSVKNTKKNENVQISLKLEKLDILKDDSDINLKISSSSVSTIQEQNCISRQKRLFSKRIKNKKKIRM